jgi:hypothetical protein
MIDNSTFSTTWNDASESEVQYTRISICSLISAVFGLGTFLVFITPWFAFLGVLAILFSLIALLGIRQADGSLTGTVPAYIGLSASIIGLIGISVFLPSYQYGVRCEADQFFRIWFEAMRQENIPQAKELYNYYPYRAKTTDAETWWKNQYENESSHRSIHQYIENKLVRTMLALGDKAKVSYYTTLGVTMEDESDSVTTIYAVTYPNEIGKTETFFVRMHGTRKHLAGKYKAAGWVLASPPAYYLPDEFKAAVKSSPMSEHNHIH